MLLSLSILLLFGFFLGALFRKLKMPGLVGMLLSGIMLGPYGLNILEESLLSFSADFRQVALLIILARAGLSLQLKDLKKVGRSAVLMSFLPACFEMLGTILLAPLLFDIPLLDAALLAAVIASASPAVIVPRMLHLMENGYGTKKSIPQLILAGDSIDDVFNIVVFTALLSLSGKGEISVSSFFTLPVSVLSGVLVGVVSGYLLSFLFEKVHFRASLKLLILLSISIFLSALEGKLENIFSFSGLLAVMAMGAVIVRKSPTSAEKISNKLSKLWIGAEILLFSLVGASVNLSTVSFSGPRTILLLLLILLMRAVGIYCCLLKTSLNKKERLFCMLSGIPKATVQAAIGGIPLSLGLPFGELILSIAVISILFTAPTGAFLLDISYKRLLGEKTKGENK